MIVTKKTGEKAIIRIEVDDKDAFAYHDSKQIGEVTTTGEDDIGRGFIVPPTITYMHVDEDYRRNGIGLELIRELASYFGPLQPGKRNIGIGNINALTTEGEALTRRAQAEGLIASFPEEHPDPDDD